MISANLEVSKYSSIRFTRKTDDTSTFSPSPFPFLSLSLLTFRFSGVLQFLFFNSRLLSLSFSPPPSLSLSTTDLLFSRSVVKSEIHFKAVFHILISQHRKPQCVFDLVNSNYWTTFFLCLPTFPLFARGNCKIVKLIIRAILRFNLKVARQERRENEDGKKTTHASKTSLFVFSLPPFRLRVLPFVSFVSRRALVALGFPSRKNVDPNHSA